MNKHAASQPRTLTRRRFLGVSGAATLAAPYLLSSCAAGQTGKPNFLFIMVDDMAKWMLEHMPAVVGRIGAEGMVFENFYVAHLAGFGECARKRGAMQPGLRYDG